MQIGIFGGSFNPPHLGHIQSLQALQKKLQLQKIIIVPTAQNPLKPELEGPSPQQRLEMVKLAVQGWGSAFEIDDREIARGGTSYTIDTIKSLMSSGAKDLCLILGSDQISTLPKWKNFDQLTKLVDIVIISRPGFPFPDSAAELPQALQALVKSFEFNLIELTTGRTVQLINIPEVDISSTELRKFLRVGKNVQKFLPLSVEQFIKQNKIYSRAGQKVTDYGLFTNHCAQILNEKKALAIRGFDLRKMTAPSEYAIITSGSSTKHVTSLAENLCKSVKDEYGLLPQSVEGLQEGRWVVVDFGSLIVHIFYDFVRQEYALENLWNKAIDMALKLQ